MRTQATSLYKRTPCSLNFKNTSRMRCIGIKIQCNKFSFNCTDKAYIGITLCHFLCSVWMSIPIILFSIFIEHGSARTHRNKIIQPVTMIYIHHCHDFIHGVVRVKISVPVNRMLQPPGFRFRIKLHHPEIMHITTYNMCDITKYTLLYHIQNMQSIIRFQQSLFKSQGCPLACFLISFYNFPGFVKRKNNGDFTNRVFPIFHGSQTYRRMPFP